MKHLCELLKPQFEDNFVYGLYVGIFLGFTVVIGFRGFMFTLRDGQVHLFILMWLNCMAAYFYRMLPIKDEFKRFIISAIVTFWFFEMHDLFWFAGTLFLGAKIGGIMIHPDVEWYLASAFKYSMFLIPLSILIRKYLVFSRRFLLLFIVQILCYIPSTLYRMKVPNPSIDFFLTRIFYDSLPYLFIVRRKAID